MKKNLLSIIILALLIVNLAMTGFMMLSVMTTNSQTAKLISDIAAALELEANGGESGGFSGSASGNVAVTDMATWGFTGDDNQIRITLKPSASDSKTHMVVIECVFSLNTASPDYATLGTDERMESMRDLVKAIINDNLKVYTEEELQDANTLELARTEILEQVQELFNSNFIYDFKFSSVMFTAY